MELEVLTGILLGGVAFVGGRGSLLGVLFGVLFIGVLTNGLTVLNINPFIRGVAIGGAPLFPPPPHLLYPRPRPPPPRRGGASRRPGPRPLRGPGAQPL